MQYITWITDDVAIGELHSSYEPFDIIINLAYINPHYNRQLEHRCIRNMGNVYEFGLYDHDSDADYLLDVLDFIIPILMEIPNHPKILFHCQSGKSRSVSVAMAYLCKKYNMNVDECLPFIKEKRPIINPRLSFINVVKNYINHT